MITDVRPYQDLDAMQMTDIEAEYVKMDIFIAGCAFVGMRDGELVRVNPMYVTRINNEYAYFEINY